MKNKQDKIIALLKENNKLLRKLIRTQSDESDCPKDPLRMFIKGNDLVMAINRTKKQQPRIGTLKDVKDMIDEANN